MKEYTSHGISHFYCPMAHHWVSQSGKETVGARLLIVVTPALIKFIGTKWKGSFWRKTGRYLSQSYFRRGEIEMVKNQ